MSSRRVAVPPEEPTLPARTTTQRRSSRVAAAPSRLAVAGGELLPWSRPPGPAGGRSAPATDRGSSASELPPQESLSISSSSPPNSSLSNSWIWRSRTLRSASTSRIAVRSAALDPSLDPERPASLSQEALTDAAHCSVAVVGDVDTVAHADVVDPSSAGSRKRRGPNPAV